MIGMVKLFTNVLVTDTGDVAQTRENTADFLEDVMARYHSKSITWPKLVAEMDRW